jgi:Tol biopolymer transport system component
VFIIGTGSPILRVSAAGGTSTKILDQPSNAPWFLPDGRHFLYNGTSKEDTEPAIYIGDAQASAADNAKNRKALMRTQSNAAYADPGNLLFVRDGTLMAQPFDAAKLATTGDAVPVAEQVAYTALPTPAQFSVSQNGVLVYRSGSAGGNSQLTWFDRQGKNLGTIGNPGLYGSLAISPDGSRVAAEKRDSSASDLWLIDAAPGGKNDRFTFDPGRETSPVWSPDGTQIVFAANPGGGVLNLFKKPSNLTGKEEEVFKSPENKNAMHWSPDGKTLSFSPYNPNTDAWTLNLSDKNEADKKAALFYKSDKPEIRDTAGHFSPDGRWLAYSSQVTGRDEVYVRPFPANEAGGQQMISLGGGSRPLWRRDGKELYYMWNGNVMAVDVTPGAVLKFGQPKLLFRSGAMASADGPYYQWDATADGSRFLVNLGAVETSQAATPLTLVQNWAAGLK